MIWAPLAANKLDTDYDCTPTTWSATATWYDNGPLGLSACHFSDPTLPGGSTKATQYYAAVASHMYDDNLCGSCAEITETSSGQKVTVMITDECPAASNPTHCSTGSNHLDISQNAFDDLEPLSTGVFNITWKIVTCPNNFLNVKGQNGANMTYQFKSGASSGWATLIVRDYPMPIRTLEYCTGLGTGCSAAAWQRAYNGWVPSGSWNTIYLRITDKGGNVANFGPINCCSPQGLDSKTETSAVYGNIPAPNMPGCSVNSPTRTNTPGPSATNTPNWTRTPTPTFTPSPSFLSLMIYNGEAANTNFVGEGAPAQYTYTFQGAGTNSSIADQTSTVYAGTRSGQVRVATTSAGYAGAGWQFSPAAGDARTINSSSYTAVEFYIRGAVGAERVGLRFGDDAGTNESATINISTYLAGGITTAWQLVTIPLSAFNLGSAGAAAWKNAIGRLVITADGATSAPAAFDYTVYIDNVMFTLRPASPTPSFSPSFTRSNTPTATPSRSATPTFTNSAIASPSQTASPTRSATGSFTASATRSATRTNSPINTFTQSATLSATRSSTPTFSYSPTTGSTFTATGTRSATGSFTPSATRSATPTNSPINTATRSATASATRSSTPTFSYSPTTGSTFTATGTRSATRTNTPLSSVTSSSTASNSPTSSATRSATPTRSVTPSVSPTFTDVPLGSSPTYTFTHSPTATRSSTPTTVSTFTQSSTRTATSTPVASPSHSPTRSATPSSTPSNTSGPSATFTLASSPTHTALPSSTATLASSPTFTTLPSATSTLVNSPSISPTFTDVPAGSSPTVTPSISPTASRSATPTLVSTASATRSATPTLISSASFTHSPVATFVSSPSYTATLAATATSTLNATLSSTSVASPSSTATGTSVNSATPSPTVQPLQPSIGSVIQPWGYEVGGETVTISGVNFEPGATVNFGTRPAASVTWVNSSTLSVTAPAGSVGMVSVSVINPSGGSVTLLGAYEYKAQPTPSGDGPNEIEDHKAAPNPCYGVNCVMAAKLKGRVDRVMLKVFTKAHVLVGARELGPQSAGWVVLPMPDGLASQSMGMYYYLIDCERDGKASGHPGKGSFWLQR